MICHEVDDDVLGNDMQIIEVELDPGESVIAGAGVMSYMEQGVCFEPHMEEGEGSILGSPGDMLDGDSHGAPALRSWRFLDGN
jgi:uncharacterized protein (AIM24 family)